MPRRCHGSSAPPATSALGRVTAHSSSPPTGKSRHERQLRRARHARAPGPPSQARDQARLASYGEARLDADTYVVAVNLVDVECDGSRPGRPNCLRGGEQQPNRTPMAQKPKVEPRRPRACDAARRRALARLRKGLDLRWTPPGSRDEVHDRSSRRRVTRDSRNG
jgi:hypothetical protein